MRFFERKNAQAFGAIYIFYLFVVFVVLVAIFAALRTNSIGTIIVNSLKATTLLRPEHMILFGARKICDLEGAIVYSTQIASGKRIERAGNSNLRIEECQFSNNNISGSLFSYKVISEISIDDRLAIQSRIRDYHFSKISDRGIELGLPRYSPLWEILAEPLALARYNIYYGRIFAISRNHWFVIFSFDTYTIVLGEIKAGENFIPETDIALFSKNANFFISGSTWLIYLFPLVAIVSILFFPKASGVRSFRSSILASDRIGSATIIVIVSTTYFWAVLSFSTAYVYFAGIALYVSLISYILSGIVFKTRFWPIPYEKVARLPRQKWTSTTTISDLPIANSEHEAVFVPVDYSCGRCGFRAPVFVPWKVSQHGKVAVEHAIEEVRRDFALICPRCGYADKNAFEKIGERRKTSLKQFGWFLVAAIAALSLGLGLFFLSQHTTKIPYVGGLISAIVRWISGALNGIALVAVAFVVFGALAWTSRRVFWKRATRDVWACVEHGYLIDNSNGEVPDEILTCIVDDSDKHQFSLVSASELRF